MFCFFKQKTAYEMRISDWSSDVGSSDLPGIERRHLDIGRQRQRPVRGGDPSGAEFFAIGGLIPRLAAVPARIADRVIGRGGGGNIGGAAHGIGLADPYRRIADRAEIATAGRSEEHTSELQSLMRISYAVFCLKK